MSKIARRSRLADPTGAIFLRYLHRDEIARLMASDTIRPDGPRAFRLSGLRAPSSDARPGSYGVHREHVPTGNQYGLSGGIVFSHRNTYEGLAA